MNDEKELRARTKMFARRIIRRYCALPKNDAAAQILGKQALRAGTSVGANYHEGHRARSKAEFISKIGDCLKEAGETLYWPGVASGRELCVRAAASTTSPRKQ